MVVILRKLYFVFRPIRDDENPPTNVYSVKRIQQPLAKWHPKTINFGWRSLHHTLKSETTKVTAYGGIM